MISNAQAAGKGVLPVPRHQSSVLESPHRRQPQALQSIQCWVKVKSLSHTPGSTKSLDSPMVPPNCASLAKFWQFSPESLDIATPRDIRCSLPGTTKSTRSQALNCHKTESLASVCSGSFWICLDLFTLCGFLDSRYTY